jgi:hypothetical protein
MFITFTKVADFLLSSQFLAPLAPVIYSGGQPKKFQGSNAPVPNTNSLLPGLLSRFSCFASSFFRPFPPLPCYISFFTRAPTFLKRVTSKISLFSFSFPFLSSLYNGVVRMYNLRKFFEFLDAHRQV